MNVRALLFSIISKFNRSKFRSRRNTISLNSPTNLPKNRNVAKNNTTNTPVRTVRPRPTHLLKEGKNRRPNFPTGNTIAINKNKLLIRPFNRQLRYRRTSHTSHGRRRHLRPRQINRRTTRRNYHTTYHGPSKCRTRNRALRHRRPSNNGRPRGKIGKRQASLLVVLL